MSTSGTVTFSQARDPLVLDALVDAGIIGVGYVPDANVTEYAQRTLNLMLKSWQAMDGLNLWKIKEATIFLQDGINSYTLGSTGNHWVLSSDITKTEIKVAAVATDTSIDVDSTTGMTATDYIGIELDDGTFHWTTVASVTDNDTVVLTDAIETGDTVAVDNDVYFYTTKADRPLMLIDVMKRDQSDNDRPTNLISRNEYYTFGSKLTEGNVTQLYFQPTLTNCTLKVYPTPSNSLDRVICTAQFPIEDLTAANHDFDCPQEWLLPIRLNLAVLLTPAAASGSTEFKILKALADEYKEGVLGFDREQASIYLQPNTQR